MLRGVIRGLVGGLMRRPAVGSLLSWPPRRPERLGLGVEAAGHIMWGPVALGTLHKEQRSHCCTVIDLLTCTSLGNTQHAEVLDVIWR